MLKKALKLKKPSHIFNLFTRFHPDMYQEECDGDSFTLWGSQQRISLSGKTESYAKYFSLYYRMK